MPDFAGSPQSVIVSRALVVLLAIPLLGVLAEMARGAGLLLRGTGAAGGERDDATGRILRTVVVVMALGTVVFAAQLVAQSAGDKYLLQHVVTWLRAGQLETNLDVALDPLACGALAVVVALVGMLAFRTRGQRGGTLVVLLGATLAILSVDLFGILLGLLLALAGLVTTVTGRGQAQYGFAALVLLGGATGLFFWGTGGDFRVDGFASDFRARLASVQVGRADELKAPTVRGDGLLTVTAYPGSLVFVDDSHTPLQQDGRELRTPFSRVALKAGTHSFRLHPGMGLDDLVLAQQPMGEGRELLLLPVGSSLAPREIGDQLVLQDASGDRPLRTQALERTFSGHGSVLRIASWLTVIFALGWAAGGAFERASHRDAALRVAVGLLGAYVLARLQPIVALALGSSLTAALLGVAAAAAVVPLVRGRLEPELEKDGAREPFAEPAFAASLAERLAPWATWLVPAPTPSSAAVATGATGTTGASEDEVQVAAPSTVPPAVGDAVCTGVLALVIVVLLVSGR